MVDRSGKGLAFHYTGTALTSVTDAADGTSTFTYDSSTGRLTRVAFADQRSVSYANTTAGLLSSVTAVDGSTTTYGYDVDGRLTTITDADGKVVTANTYTAGRVTKQVTDDGAHTATLAWDVTGGAVGGAEVACVRCDRTPSIALAAATVAITMRCGSLLAATCIDGDRWFGDAVVDPAGHLGGATPSRRRPPGCSLSASPCDSRSSTIGTIETLQALSEPHDSGLPQSGPLMHLVPLPSARPSERPDASGISGNPRSAPGACSDTHRAALWQPIAFARYSRATVRATVEYMTVPAASHTDETSDWRLPLGLGCAMIIAAVGTVAAHWLPVIGAPVLAIGAGVLMSSWVQRNAPLRRGLGFASGRVLQLAVVVLGSQLSLRQVAHVGAASLPVMLGTLVICLGAANVLGRGLGIGPGLRTLIGVGTAICGASAIAAVSPVIRAKGNDVAYAVTTIFLFNVAAVLAFPPLGHVLGLSQHAFGLFAGTAVNDTSSVVAAAAAYGHTASNYAVVVKLTRTLMIVPVTVAVAAVTARRQSSVEERASPVPITRLIPWFLIGFLAVAGINSLGWIPRSAHAPLQTISVYLITLALAAIGLSTDIRRFRAAGVRPLLLGFLLWVTVAAASLLLQAATHTA